MSNSNGAPLISHDNDSCVVAEAMGRSPLVLSSYNVIAKWPSNIPHVTSLICTRASSGSENIETKTHDSSGSVQAIFAFKSARTGSTFVTKVIAGAAKATKRPTSMFFEPYCDTRCFETSISASTMENALNKIVTRSCITNTEVDKCKPSETCRNKGTPANEYGDPLFITGANPRFFNPQMDWKRVFESVSQPRILSMRRTNHILMAYSKFHWVDGCGFPNIPIDKIKEQRELEGAFTVERLLMCVDQYTIAEQELSSSIAFHAARSLEGIPDPFIVAYEDVIAGGEILTNEITKYLKLDTEKTSKPASNSTLGEKSLFSSKATKFHTKPFCSYHTVDCKSLQAGLEKEHPCLALQLQRIEEGLTWTVPMLADGTIHVKGMCSPLPPLNSYSRKNRLLADLYTITKE